MTDTSQTMSDDLSQEAPAPVTAGSLLRLAREANGIHIAALAVSIRVPVKKLEALEANRLDELHDPVFIRALAGLVCRALKIEPAPVMDLLPQSAPQLLRGDVVDINVPFQRPGEAQSSSFLRQIPKPALWMVALLLVATGLLFLMPDAQEVSTQATGSPAALVNEPVPILPVAVIGPNSTSVPVPPVVAVSPPSSVKLPARQVQEQVSPRPLTAAPAPLAAIRVDQGSLLQFKTTDESWIQVTDGKGEILLSRNLARGETALVAKGQLPLQVVIGRADVTEVWLRGKSFPLQGLSRENVARFEVGP